MRLTNQKKMAARLFGCAPDRIWIDPERTADIKEAVTRQDIKSLLSDGLIKKKQKNGQSKSRSRLRIIQKRKGRLRGQGSRKGKVTARTWRKGTWIHKVRAQRVLLKELKTGGRLSAHDYRNLILKTKGGFFRSIRHIKLYIGEKGLLQKSDDKLAK